MVEPWTKYVSKDGKEHFLIYSTGNFASGLVGVQQKTSAMIYLVLGKNSASGTFVRGVGYVPLRMDRVLRKGSSVRPLDRPEDQAPGGSWMTWYGDFGRANRVFANDGDLTSKFCHL